MGRILAIDYGKKRTGIAVSDPMQLIAGEMKTLPTAGLWDYLKEYLLREAVDIIVVGKPVQMNNLPSEAFVYIEPFVKRLRTVYPGVSVEYMDERFTSSMASRALIEGGWKKKSRQEKERVDSISASLILQSFMEWKKNRKTANES